ncbi:MAG: aminomethyl-transferring glycine dehydrogenase subunit GcvPA [Pseudomonadota bacterium]
MPFIPHTADDIAKMLETIGVDSIDALFDEIPQELMIDGLPDVPAQASEMAVTRLMHERAARDSHDVNFIGAGAYEHHIPAVVWELTTRGEFYSAYTPYQAEASQGTLQVIYEYQTMMAALTGMEVSNASLYDGATALAESALMAVRLNRKSKSKRLLVPSTVSPRYRDTCRSLAGSQELKFELVRFADDSGVVSMDSFKAYDGEDITAVVIQQPNFFGRMEEVHEITNWAHANGALVIAVVNPTSLAVLCPPGEWGDKGADIVCGEGQPLGVPLSSGGPYYGFMTCSKKNVRQMPGRIVGRTVDLDGRSGYTLTLQAREQHIRRSRATSNICTNQGLVVTASTMYMTLLGAEGLARVAGACQSQTGKLVNALSAIDGVRPRFSGPQFHEAVLELDRPVGPVLEQLARRHIIGGFALDGDYPELGNALLVCATETRTDEDIDSYASALRDILAEAKVA